MITLTKLSMLLMCCAGAAWSLTRTADGAAEAVAPSDLVSIRAAYDAQRHAAFPLEGGGYMARNPAQQWRTHFDARGFRTEPDAGGWQWGLELRSYGFAGEERAIAAQPEIRSVGQRVTYVWDEVLEEWFVNDRRGLEHGFTVKERPAQAAPTSSPGPLNFLLAIRGGLRPELSPDGLTVRFFGEGGSAVVNYAGLKVWDADGKPLPARFEPADQGICLRVDERGARYPITIDPIAQQAYLKASNTGADDFFGTSVAISGNTAVVGADGEDSNARQINGEQSNNNRPNSGAAYVFVRDGSGWVQQAYLKASNADETDRFGSAVAISGDTVVVGADSEDSNATGVNGTQENNSLSRAGAAYVFVRNGATWTQQAYLKASNPDAGDDFGNAVAIAGNTVVVGAPGERSAAVGVNGNQNDNNKELAGAAYVFVRSGTSWTQQAYLKASNTDTFQGFGAAVAISGETVVVGAAGEGSSANSSGAAYVFARVSSSWSQQAYLKASNIGAEDQFGYEVAISGDTVVVGAPYEDSSATGVGGNQSDNNARNAGAAYVFKRFANVWQAEAYLKAFNTDTRDLFGFSVGISGDTVVVGAVSEGSSATGINGNQADNSLIDAGAAYVYARSGATWSPQSYVKASNTGENDIFGIKVALSGDTVLVSAEHEDSAASGINGDQADNSAISAGAVYVFDDDLGERPQDGPDFIVTTLDGDNDGLCSLADCSLGEAVQAANENPDASAIDFKDGLSGTIVNSIPEGLPIRTPLTINGPGARILTLSGNNTARLFIITSGSSAITISGLTLANGRVSSEDGRAGAILNTGNLSLVNCAFVRNQAREGGAIYSIPPGPNNLGSLTLQNCTFSENSGFNHGGAIFFAGFFGFTTASAVNCTFDANGAGESAGAIYVDATFTGPSPFTGNVDLSLTDCTLSQNSGRNAAGGIHLDAKNSGSPGVAKLTLRNTILRTGEAGLNLISEGGTIVSGGHNLSNDDGSGFLTAQSDRPNTDPRLAVLQSNGGPTDTVALLSDSPAINTGDNANTPETDQRGFLRAGVNDIGAFEFDGVAPPPPPTPTPQPTATPEPSATPTPIPTATPQPNRFANISTRLRVEIGENVLIGGFIVTGSMQKRIIIRALGPSLPVEDRLANPLLELYNGSGELIAVNDNWQEAPNAQEVIDSTIPPPNELESALIGEVGVGAYTAVVRDVADGEGVGLVEVYDLGSNQDSKLANISTRGRVLTADNVMIGGLIVTGSSAQNVIVRAIGPSLPVEGRLEDPFLELFDGQGNSIATNNNWRDTQPTEIEATTIPPTNDLEAAVVIALPPAAYTVVVSGVNGGTGVGLIEAYALP